jgi:hypothetical protein
MYHDFELGAPRDRILILCERVHRCLEEVEGVNIAMLPKDFRLRAFALEGMYNTHSTASSQHALTLMTIRYSKPS